MRSLLEPAILLNVTVVFIALIGISVDDYVNNNSDNNCSMTYMFDDSGVVHVPMPLDHSTTATPFSNYKLYLYCEGRDCARKRALGNVTFTVGDIPVLYVPGNADSHMQIRSIATVALEKSRELAVQHNNSVTRFQFFTIDFRSELSGLYGPILYNQAAYVKYCVNFILGLFESIEPAEHRPTSVVLIGNSMGGIVSRGAFLPSQMPASLNSTSLHHERTRLPVHTVLTLSSPHRRPVISFDVKMNDFYAKANAFWLDHNQHALNNTVLVSLHGGHRDTMVRTDLSNLNDWRDRSRAGIIFGNTESMPFVWKSIDHVAMVWCKELVTKVVRALFDLVDPRTSQLAEDRVKREAILRHHFERDVPVELLMPAKSKHRIFRTRSMHALDNHYHLNYEFNSFNQANKTIVINLQEAFRRSESSHHDSLFIYTNIAESDSFSLCKSLRKAEDLDNSGVYNCTDYLDLFKEFGRTIAAATDNQISRPIRVFHVHDLRRLYQVEGFSKLVVNIPVRDDTPENHQIFIKLDWFNKRDRQLKLLNLPGLLSTQVPISLNALATNETEPVTYRRVYLPSLHSVVQAFELTNKAASHSNGTLCDEYLKSEYASRVSTPFRRPPELPSMLSTMSISFVERVSSAQSEPITLDSQPNVYFHRPLKVRLSVNVPDGDGGEKILLPYLEFIQFDVKHLLHVNTLKKMAENGQLRLLDQCQTYDGFPRRNGSTSGKTDDFIRLESSATTVLAQYLRFYTALLVPFIVLIVQFYDLINLTNDKYVNHRDLVKHKNRLILYRYHTHFFFHLAFSLTITLVIYFFQSDLYEALLFFTNDKRSFFALNDYQLLKFELLFNPSVPFVLYWSAFAVLNLATCLISCALQGLIFLLNTKQLARAFNVNSQAFLRKFWLSYGLYLLFCLVSCLFSSALCQAMLMLGELLRLALLNPARRSDLSSAITKYVNYSNDLTRFVFYVIMLVLNLPSVSVWLFFIDLQGLASFKSFIYDSAFVYTMATIALNMFACFRRADLLSFLTLKKPYLTTLVSLNLLLSILYSSVHVYRLYNFILIHLFLVALCDHKQSFQLRVTARRQLQFKAKFSAFFETRRRRQDQSIV